MTGKADAVNFMYKSKYFIALALVVVLVTAQASSAFSISPSNVTTYNKWTAVTPPAYTVFTDGSTIYAKNGATGAIDYSGTTASTVIQNAINGLTAGRSTTETVAIRGAFTITSSISVPSYTILDLGDASFTRSGTGYHMFSLSSVHDIEFHGGIINSAPKAVEAYDTNEISMSSVSNILIQGITVNLAAEDAIAVNGSTYNVKVVDSSFYEPNRHAIDITGSSTIHNLIIANNYVNGTLIYDAITVYVTSGNTITIEGNTLENVKGTAASTSAIHVEDTAGGSLNNIVIDGNSIKNSKFGITSATARPITISDNVIQNTTRGIQLQNPILSSISGNVIDNSQNTATSYGIYLYGITSSTIANNVIRGPGASSLMYGIYWDGSGSFIENTISGNVISRALEGIHSVGSKNVFDSNVIRYSQNSAVTIQAGAQYNIFSNNIFYNTGQQTSNTYPDVDIAATGGANTISQFFKDNVFLSDTANKPNYNINFQSAGNTNHISVIGNRFSGAATSVFSSVPTTAGILIKNNDGYNPLGVATITPGASPYTYTNNDGVSEAIYIDAGTVSAIAKNSITVFTSTGKTVWLEPGESTTVTYTVVPTMTKDRK